MSALVAAAREVADTVLEEQLISLPFNDDGNARRLVAAHRHELRYVPRVGWHVWDGKRWKRDEDGAPMRLMKETIRGLKEIAVGLDDDDKRGRKLSAHAFKSGQRVRLEAALKLAESELDLIVHADKLDADPYSLNVLNGTIDLRTGELREHDREDMITKLAPVKYDADARDEVFDRFLRDTTGGDKQLEGYLRRAAGYSLTGDTGEEVLFFAHGPGRTGKSTFLEAFKAVLGDYAVTADFETFLKGNTQSGPRKGIAQLAGARLVIAIEAEEGRKLNESLVNALTGGDTVRGAFLWKDSFELVPQFTLWLAANHAPQVRDDNTAIWSRLRRLPFECVVPEGQRDPKVKKRLRKRNAAVLAWAVQGCLEWQRDGLGSAPAVEQATTELRADMDPLTDFLTEECQLGADKVAVSGALWDAYKQWAARNRQPSALRKRDFEKRLTTRGFKPDQSRLGGGPVQRFRHGIALRQDEL